MTDFKNLQEVLLHVQEAQVLDLPIYTTPLFEDQKINDGMVAPVKGLYVIGQLDPIISDQKIGYTKEAVITDYVKAIKQAQDIFDRDGNILVKGTTLKRQARVFRTEPYFNTTAIRICAAVVQKYLSTLCKHTRCIGVKYRMYDLVKESHHELIDNEAYCCALDKLLTQVQAFVNRDNWNMYVCRLKGSQLIIEKGIDYRIFRYYEMEFEKDEPSCS